LHHALHKYFEAAGVSTNDTFSMHLDYSHGGVKQSRDAPGRIGFVIPITPDKRPGEDNIFGDSRLVQGVISNVAVPQLDGDAGDGSASHALRLTRVPEDSWTQIVRAALQAAKPAEPKSPLIVNQLKNKRGLPLAVAVFWDPSPYSAVDAALRWKKDEAAWRMDEPEQADLRCMFVPFDPEREVEVATYIEQAGSRAWSRGELIVDNFEVEAEEPSSAAGGQTPEVPEPVLEVTRVLPDGSLDVKMALFQKYLEVDATQHKAEHILRQFVKTFTGDASPRLPPRQAPQGPSSAAASQDAVAALQNDRPDVVTRNLEAPGSLAELERLHGPWTVDVTLPNAKLRVLINGRGHGFGVAVGAIKVQQDAIFILPGAGGFLKDEEEKVENMFATQCELSSGNCEVLFYTSPREKSRARMFTLYGLFAKLAIEGYTAVALNGHDVEKCAPSAAGAGGGLDRFKVTCVGPKTWAAKQTKKRKASEPDGVKAPGDWLQTDALAAVHDLSLLPNQLVKIVWYSDIVTHPKPVVRLVSPALCWSRTIDFAENQIFQFA